MCRWRTWRSFTAERSKRGACDVNLGSVAEGIRRMQRAVNRLRHTASCMTYSPQPLSRSAISYWRPRRCKPGCTWQANRFHFKLAAVLQMEFKARKRCKPCSKSRPKPPQSSSRTSAIRISASQLFPVPCSLFPVPCSLFPVPCSLFPVLTHFGNCETSHPPPATGSRPRSPRTFVSAGPQPSVDFAAASSPRQHLKVARDSALVSLFEILSECWAEATANCSTPCSFSRTRKLASWSSTSSNARNTTPLYPETCAS